MGRASGSCARSARAILFLRPIPLAKTLGHLQNLPSAFGPDIEEEKSVPADRRKDQHGPNRDEEIVHSVAFCGVASIVCLPIQEPANIPRNASANEDAPATSGAICCSLETMALTMRNASGPIAPSTRAA